MDIIIKRKKKIGMITGISGQDGSYLAEHLLEKDYQVFGMIRRNSIPENQEPRIHHLENIIETFYGDVTDMHSIERNIKLIKPDEIYNIAAQSHVRISFDIPNYTVQTNAIGAFNMLESFKNHVPYAHFYQASSCLPAGTKVLVKKKIKRTRAGNTHEFIYNGAIKNIEDIKIGDEVLSFNEKTSKKEYNKVEVIGNRIANDMFTLKTSNNNELRLSGNHPVYVIDKGWVRTDELIIGDKILQYTYPGLRGRIMKGKTNEELYGETRSKEISKKCSGGQKNKNCVHPWKGKRINEIYKDDKEKLKYLHYIMSESKKGLTPWNADIKNSKNKKHLDAWEKAKNNIGISNKKLWKNEEWANIQINKMIKRTRKNTWLANKSEKKFEKFLQEICPNEFKYNSYNNNDFLIIERKIPDFININGKKKIIEYNGDYWHKDRRQNDKKRMNLFKKHGYETLEIFESEFKFDKIAVENKIKTFLHNPGVEIIKICEIVKHTISEKVYDIQVANNHNFFAYGILVHNSEMFGNSVDPDGYQRETTPMVPVSPYGIAKLFAFNMVRHYRKAYKLFVSNGILFNHECITFNTPVMIYKDGLIDIRYISDIVPFNPTNNNIQSFDTKDYNIFILDRNGKFTKIKTMTASKFDYTKPDYKIKKIITHSGILHTTSHHKLINDKDQKIRCDNFNVGDKLKIGEYPELNSIYTFKPDIAWVIGFFVAEGSIGRKNSFCFTNKDENIINKCKNILEKYGFICNIRDIKSGFKENSFSKRLECKTNTNIAFATWLNKSTINSDKTKKIPIEILNSDINTIKNFIDGYYMGDGLKSTMKDDNDYKAFKTNSPMLMLGLSYLFNIINYETHQYADSSWHHMYCSNLKNKDYNSNKGDHLKIPLNQIKRIGNINNYNNWVFDIETETSTFTAGTGLINISNSPRRASNFVTNKIVYGALRIKYGLQETLELGNLDSYRDWGHSKDYTRAMIMILNHNEPDDFIISSMFTHSIRDLCDYIFTSIGLDYKDYVKQNPKYLRPEELKYLKGDSSKARKILGWSPNYSFESMLDEMMKEAIKKLKIE